MGYIVLALVAAAMFLCGSVFWPIDLTKDPVVFWRLLLALGLLIAALILWFI